MGVNQRWARAHFSCALADLRASASKSWARSAHGNVGLNITNTPESGLG